MVNLRFYNTRRFGGFGDAADDAAALQIARTAGYTGTDADGARSWYRAMFGVDIAVGAATSSAAVPTSKCELNEKLVQRYYGGVAHWVCEPLQPTIPGPDNSPYRPSAPPPPPGAALPPQPSGLPPCDAHEHYAYWHGHWVCDADAGYQTSAAGPPPQPPIAAPPPPPPRIGAGKANDLMDLTGRTVNPNSTDIGQETGTQTGTQTAQPAFNKWWLAAGALGLAVAVVLYKGRA